MSSLPSIARAVDRFIQDLITLRVDQSIDGALENAVVAEHELRLLFGAGHQLQGLHIGLIDLFGLPPTARRTRTREIGEEPDASDHYIFPLRPSFQRQKLMPSTVLNIEAFQQHWNLFTHGSLSKMTAQDWQNVVVAGGSVLACLMTPRANMSRRRQNEYFQSNVYASSYIDIFFYGLTPEQAEQKAKDIYKAVSAASPWKVVCVRKANTVSIHTSYPFRPVQIVLRQHQSPAEILASFDVDASCCLYDGTGKVWVNPRSLAAIIRQTNTVDIARRSEDYETRLAKYAARGFEIYLPLLDREDVDPALYDRNLKQLPNGLARLLVLEAAFTRPYLYAYIRYPEAGNPAFPQSDNVSDPSWMQIPYGPAWDAKAIKEMVLRKISWISSPHNPLNVGTHRHKHIFVVGNMKQCIAPACEECTSNDADLEQSESGSEAPDIYFRGPISFLAGDSNPVLVGSFAPTGYEDWVKEAYCDHDEDRAIVNRRRRIIVIDSDSDSEWDSGSDTD